ncbi:MAG: OmpH family outer membrane protein [Muribaculaceae bacterium]|nr:OmpH family outer membrane protein [Muribaculaceae bacterium]
MRKFIRTIGIFALAVLAINVSTGCNNSDTKETKKVATKAKSSLSTENLPNYRYVDLDTVLSRYNLAKDYNEEMLRMQNNAESQMRRHENEIKSFATTVQNKVQNNSYLTQESYKADEQKMANMQNNAQRTMNTLQNNIAQAAEQAQKTINDSITAFIESYNKTRGYDAIFFKAATLYANPALDITDEVVEGLNARYNKVKK